MKLSKTIYSICSAYSLPLHLHSHFNYTSGVYLHTIYMYYICIYFLFYFLCFTCIILRLSHAKLHGGSIWSRQIASNGYKSIVSINFGILFGSSKTLETFIMIETDEWTFSYRYIRDEKLVSQKISSSFIVHHQCEISDCRVTVFI